MTATFETMTSPEIVAAQGHPLTPFWADQAKRFYGHPTADVFVGEAGRGSIKSGFGSRIAFNELLFGDFEVPGGEIHYWVDVSENKSEANQRLGQYEEWLKNLGLPFERRGDELVLPDVRRGFLVRAAQVGRLSGFRAIGMRVDEAAKLTSADSSANPLPEIWASGSAMMVTHLRHRPKRLLLSSPLGLVGFFNSMARKGDTEDQIAAQQVPTWVANPSTSEAETRRLEPNERVWAREYLARAQAGALAVFEPSAIDRAFMPTEAVPKPLGRFGVIDASSGKKDTWSFAIASWCDVGGVTKLVFDRIDGFAGRFFEQLSGEAIVQTVADALKSFGVNHVHADQRESLLLRSAFQRHGITFYEWPWTQPSKERAIATIRRWLAEDRLVLPEHEKMKEELLTFEERVSPSSGAFTFGARGSGHDDFVSLLVTTATAENEQALRGSPSNDRISMFQALSAATPRQLELMRRNLLGVRF